MALGIVRVSDADSRVIAAVLGDVVSNLCKSEEIAVDDFMRLKKNLAKALNALEAIETKTLDGSLGKHHLNPDFKTRDKAIFGHWDQKRYATQERVWFSHLDTKTFRALYDDNFFLPDDKTKKGRPTPTEFLDFVEKHPAFQIEGEVISPASRDYAIIVTGVGADPSSTADWRDLRKFAEEHGATDLERWPCYATWD